MFVKCAHHQLCSVRHGGPKPHGDASTRAENAVFMLCKRRYTGSTYGTRRPRLQLTSVQSWIPSRPSVLAIYGNLSTSMAQEDGFGKWGATVTEVIPATIDKVWAVLADFDGIQRNFPQFFGSCETVEGEKNKPGSLRLATAAVPTPAGKIIDARERLLTLDDANHTTSWLVESNGLGWTSFQAHISCESVENGHTLVKWTYEVNASSTKNITEEEYVKKQSGFYLEVLHTIKGIVAQ